MKQEIGKYRFCVAKMICPCIDVLNQEWKLILEGFLFILYFYQFYLYILYMYIIITFYYYIYYLYIYPIYFIQKRGRKTKS